MRSLFAVLLFVLVALWAPLADAQISSYGPPPSAPAGVQRVLCSIRGANFNSTADQACAIAAGVSVWSPTAVWVTNCSTSMTLAAGGFYPAGSKGGTPLVAATQVYTAATGSTIVVNTALAAGIATTRFAIGTVFLSLTTAQGAAATCDVYVVGIDLT